MHRLIAIALCILICLMVLALYPTYYALEIHVEPGTDAWYEIVDPKQFYFGGGGHND